MNLLRKLLFPFAIIYWLVTFVRNWLYDKGVFKSTSFNVPIIAVGNLSVGGTGKTPQIEYLIRLLADTHKIAVLSRGYKRKSKGFVLADEFATAASIGDEPFQIYSKFKNKCMVAVDVNRTNGITTLLKSTNKPDVILLDDAFQHRKVKAGFYILLTTYEHLFVDDYILPFGNLREPSSGKKRADCIIVTKCPDTLTVVEKEKITLKLNVSIPVFFSKILYSDFLENKIGDKISLPECKAESKTIISGIANPKLFLEKVSNLSDQILIFPDHYNFSEHDIDRIKKIAKNNKIITTEKDFVRIKDKFDNNLFFMPIISTIDNQDFVNYLSNALK